MRFLISVRDCPVIVAAFSVLLSALGCVGERGAAGPIAKAMTLFARGDCGDHYLGEIDSSFRYQLDSALAGETSGLTVEMMFPDSFSTPILSTYTVEIVVPPDFVFLGFDALGVGAQVGAWDFEWSNPDGVFDGADFTIVHRDIDHDFAYSDSDGSGAYSSGIDPTAEHTTGSGGEHIITLSLPDGGMSQDIYGMCSYFSFDARYTLFDGILGLPTTPGTYAIEITATSVDLDTGNATDGVPPHPLTYNDTFVFRILHPDTLFYDGFENGDTSQWSVTVP